jgi:hypothetical protein
MKQLYHLTTAETGDPTCGCQRSMPVVAIDTVTSDLILPASAARKDVK